jgi:hypothetical protein
VGEDQAPHVELAREIVRRFNNLYGEVFPEPQTLLTEAKRIPGTDGRKMSKSYGNAIYLKDDPETVRQKLREGIRASGCGIIQGIFQVGSLPHALTMKSMELFAREVMPALRAEFP